MKLTINTDFTKFPRALSVLKVGADGAIAPYDSAGLAHDERHLRRRILELASGEKILVDLPEPVVVGSGDRLVLEDGRQVEIIAAQEHVYDIRSRDAVHLAELAWHIGNRRLPAAIEATRILIPRDHDMKTTLKGLGAVVVEAAEPFEPLRATHSGHGHTHDDSHSHSHASSESHASHAHSHSHSDHHGEPEGRDRYGRLPGDPHYGHNHA